MAFLQAIWCIAILLLQGPPIRGSEDWNKNLAPDQPRPVGVGPESKEPFGGPPRNNVEPEKNYPESHTKHKEHAELYYAINSDGKLDFGAFTFDGGNVDAKGRNAIKEPQLLQVPQEIPKPKAIDKPKEQDLWGKIAGLPFVVDSPFPGLGFKTIKSFKTLQKFQTAVFNEPI